MNSIDKMKIHDAISTVMGHNLDDGMLMSDAISNLNHILSEMKQKYLPNEVNLYMMEEYDWKVSE